MKKYGSKAISGTAVALIIIVIIAVAGVSAYSLFGSQTTTSTTSQQTSTSQSSTSQQLLSCVGVAQSNPNFSTLVTAIQDAGLASTLSGTGPFTIFAPTNTAFSNLPAGVLNYLLSNKTALTQVLEYHVVSGNLMAAQVVAHTSLTSLQGSSIPVAVNGSTVKVGIATVTTANVPCSNGVIHVIDHVLVPGGIMNIVQTAEYYNFSTLVTAVKAAGLVGALSGTSPLTVFAPTNAAFAALPSGTLSGLLANTTALTNVLTYHVVAGEHLAANVVTLTTLKTLEGQNLTITVSMGTVKINSATVIETNIICSNGVIHVINEVLLPP
jgi:transforming growth factor-beta-induced protein